MIIRKILCAVLVLSMVCPLFAACSSTTQPPVIIRPGDGFELTGELTGTGTLAAGIPEELCGVSVVAENATGRIVPADTAFKLKFDRSTSAEVISEYLSITPSVSLNIQKLSDNEFRVSPQKELDKNTVYRLSFGKKGSSQLSFAFQTESGFALSSSIPADLAYNVPINTGIEFEFSSAVLTGINISDYVTVTPEITFKAQLYPGGRRLVIIPQKKLKENTEYSVTVSKDLPSVSNEKLAEDISIRFRTEAESTAEKNNVYSLSLRSGSLNFRPGAPAAFYFNFYNKRSSGAYIKEISASIYKYRSEEDLVKAIKDYNAAGAALIYTGKAYEYPTAGLIKVTSEKLEFSENGWQSYATLPQLKEGCYIAEISVEIKAGNTSYTEKVQLLVQISDISVYTEYSQGKLLFFTMDSSGGNAGKTSVKAEFFNRETNFSTPNTAKSYKKVTSSGENGLCVLEAPAELNSAICTVSNGSSTLVVPVGSIRDFERTAYYGYVFTDREVYFPDDTVNFNGLVIPGYNGEAKEKLWLRVNYKGAKYPLEVSEDGSFYGKYELEGYTGYGITLSFVDENDRTVLSKFVRISAEDKPVYTADISFDKLFYEKGDTANITVSASFFDGTPASGLSFRIYANVNNNSTYFDVVTDGNGNGTAKYRLPAANSGSTSPVRIGASAELMGNESASLYVYNSAVYIHSDFYFRCAAKYDSNGTSYSEIYLHNTDTSVLKTPADLEYPVFPDNTVGTPKAGTAKVSLIKVSYVKRSLGTEYDPINKITVENYRYDRVETVIKTEALSFTDGIIKLDHVKEEKDFEGYYYYSVSYGGYILTANASSRNSEHFNYVSDNLRIESDKESYIPGETMRLTLYRGINKPESINALVSVIYNGGYESFSVNSPEFEIPYISEYIPGAAITVTVANENGSFTLLQYVPCYDFERNNSLEVTVSTDKSTYRPGEEVKITVSVKDKNGNNAAGKTTVTLAVVDEACFALGDQNVDILAELYRRGTSVPPYDRNTRFDLFYNYSAIYDDLYYTAEDAVTESAGADNGASKSEGDVYVRKLFSDNPVFTALLIENGIASFTFTAPDNVTEWRLTAIAADSGNGSFGSVSAGSGNTGIIATLPFFVNISYSDTYIVGDDITASARSYGNAANSGDTVNYTATLYNENGKVIKTLEAKSKVGEFCFFSFGKAEEGSYKLRITAICGDNADAVEYGISSVRSAVLTTVQKTLKAEEIKSISPAKYPVILTVYNREQKSFVELARMLSYKNSARADSTAASVAVSALLSAYCGTEAYSRNSMNESKKLLNENYLTNGLISLLPYSSGDLKLSAMIAAFCPAALTASTKDILRASFEKTNYGTCTEEELVYSLLGLAAVGAPVLNDLIFVSSSCASFSAESKLVLAAAFAVIGDYSAANDIYGAMRSEMFTEEENAAYFTASSTEERIALTATALVSASVCNRKDAELMKNYLLEHTSRTELYNMQLAFYLANYIPADGEATEFTYTLGKDSITESIAIGSSWHITLTKQEFESFEITSGGDKLYVNACYTGTPDEAMEDNGETDLLKLTKTVKKTEKGMYLITVSYSVTSDKDHLSFTVSDVIPSGARFVRHGSGSNSSKGSYLWLSNSGQNMRGTLYCYNYTESKLLGLHSRTYSGSFSYYVRTAIPGEYVVESAFAQNAASGSFTVSERQTITLK